MAESSTDMAHAAQRWWFAVLLSAALLLAVVAFFVFRSPPRPAPPAPPPVAEVSADAGTAASPSGACAPFEVPSLTAGSSGPTAPLILWAVGNVRLFVDGTPTFSPPERPIRLSAGPDHTLRAEAKGEEALSTRFRLTPNVPALFHAQVDEGMGITLVRLNVTCSSCEFPTDRVEIDLEPSTATGFELLKAAAASLRTDKWQSALERLRRVPKRDREKPLYLRLASSLYQAAGEPARARALAQQIPKARANDLPMLLAAMDGLAKKEQAGKDTAVLDGWNAVIDRFGALAGRFQDAAPGPLAATAKRLEALGTEFEKATEQKDTRTQRSVLDAAEQAVRRVAEEIRSAKPGDCQFQDDVLAALKAP